MPTIPNSIIAAHAAAAMHRGVDVLPLLDRYNLGDKAVLAGEGRSERNDFGLWLGHLWLEMGDEAGGFLSQPMKPGTFAMANHAVISAGTLRRALARSSQFFELVSDSLRVRLEEAGNEARLIFELTDSSPLDRRVFHDSLLIIWLRWASWLIDQAILPERVYLAFDWPAWCSEYPAMYGCPLYAGQAVSALVLSKDYLDLPLARSPEDLPEFLSQAPAVLLSRYRSDHSLAQQVRQLLSNSDNPMALDQTHLAERLSMSPATLRRRLHREGTHFQALKDQWRRGRAIHLLKTSDCTIQQIAEALGFSEASAFHRAFKKWTRFNPGDYRSNPS